MTEQPTTPTAPVEQPAAPAPASADTSAAGTGEATAKDGLLTESTRVLTDASHELNDAGVPGAKLALLASKFSEVAVELSGLVTREVAPKILPIVERTSQALISALQNAAADKPAEQDKPAAESTEAAA